MAKAEYRPDRPSLIGSRLKIKRAEEHLDKLEAEIGAYIEREPYRVADQPDIEDEWLVTRFTEVREYPDPGWGVRVGELLHDLRSSLDNLVWQLVLVNGNQPGDHNQFPIYTDPARPPGPARLKALKNARATRLDDMLFGVEPVHAAAIKDLQPYLGFHVHREHKAVLATVAELNNIDKHRFVHPAVGVREQGKVGLVKHISGPPPTDVEIVYPMGPIYPGAELFRWRVIGPKDCKVTIEGEIPYDIAFGHPKATLNRLDWLHERTGQIIERFAPAFPPGPDEPNGHDSTP